MTLRHISAAGLAAVLLAGSQTASAQSSRAYDLSGFDRVRNSSALNVVVTRGPQSVSASGDKAVLERLEMEVTDGTLVIRLKEQSGGWWWSRSTGARVQVSVPALRGTAVNGSGNMTVTGASGDRFQAGINGSGNLDIRGLSAREVELAVNGSGALRVIGTARQANMAMRGSGTISATELAVDTVNVAVDGSGDVVARATGSAAISVNGSGSATVRGTSRCTKAVRGSGSASCGR